jgi:hypothetical protein
MAGASFASVLTSSNQLREGCVVSAVDGGDVTVRIDTASDVVVCRVLDAGSRLILSADDPVLICLTDEAALKGIVLGRIGPYQDGPEGIVPADELATRPKRLVLESQGDIVLRNSRAKLTLSAEGDVEIVSESVTTRSHRLLRLLAPLIKLN